MLEATEDDERAQGVIQSVVTAGQIIEAMAAAGQPLRLTALAHQLGEPKAKMHRHLATLKYLGFVDQDAQTECYRLAPKLAHIGQAASDQFDLRRLAEPYMMRLRDLTRQTVVLSVPASGDAIISAVVESPNMITISVRLGYRLSAYASAQGRVTLAFAPADIQQRILARKLQALTPRTIIDPGQLRERLARAALRHLDGRDGARHFRAGGAAPQFRQRVGGRRCRGRNHATRPRPGRPGAASALARVHQGDLAQTEFDRL
jgi:IclR family KDG regulon transcriptional repressor